MQQRRAPTHVSELAPKHRIKSAATDGQRSDTIDPLSNDNFRMPQGFAAGRDTVTVVKVTATRRCRKSRSAGGRELRFRPTLLAKQISLSQQRRRLRFGANVVRARVEECGLGIEAVQISPSRPQIPRPEKLVVMTRAR